MHVLDVLGCLPLDDDPPLDDEIESVLADLCPSCLCTWIAAPSLRSVRPLWGNSHSDFLSLRRGEAEAPRSFSMARVLQESVGNRERLAVSVTDQPRYVATLGAGGASDLTEGEWCPLHKALILRRIF